MAITKRLARAGSGKRAAEAVALLSKPARGRVKERAMEREREEIGNGKMSPGHVIDDSGRSLATTKKHTNRDECERVTNTLHLLE